MTAQRSSYGDDSNHYGASNETSQGAGTSGLPAFARQWQGSTTDSELAQRVADALRHTGHPALGKLHVSSQFGIITLQGPVPNTYLKVLAMKAALTVGGWWVINCLEVPVCRS